MMFLDFDFVSGFGLGMTVWLLAMGCRAAWRFLQSIITPENKAMEV